MKITALIRTLNEQEFIGRCCQNHQFCDEILVADGGSSDDTVRIACGFANVKVRRFSKKVNLADGSFMNPEPEHMNFLLDWANETGADWVIMTDCDTWGNRLLQHHARSIFFKANDIGKSGILVNQFYLWGTDYYFPKITIDVSQWAFKADYGLRYDESKTTFFDSVAPGVDRKECLIINEPYCLLHYVSDEKREPEKVKRYKAWGKDKTHLLDSIYAPPEPLPQWVKEFQI